MAETRNSEAAMPARLLLIDGRSALADLAGPLAAEFAISPIVVELASGRPALDLMKSSAFDLIIADLDALGDLANGSSDRIARLARSAGDALLLVRSEGCSISVALEGMRAGAHECVAADLDTAALARRIGELARRHGKAHLLAPIAPAPEMLGAQPRAASSAPEIPVMRDLVLPMWRQEQRIIEDAIRSFAGNIGLAAAALELSPSTIYRKRQAWAEMEMKRA
jgi:DNA-binding NarL/FixJ family response regulator